MNLLDLFSGIGGFSLGLERAGFKTVAFCEIDNNCRRVLRKHWPDVPIYDDIRTLSATRLAADGVGRIDAICGGFPCQDISIAGRGAGLAGERSGLWREYARIVGELRPRYVIVENVSAMLSRGMGDVLGDMAALGYDCWWDCIPACAVGAPHRRDRVWIVAANTDARGQRIDGATAGDRIAAGVAHADQRGANVADPIGESGGRQRGVDSGSPEAREGKGPQRQRVRAESFAGGSDGDASDAERFRLAFWRGLQRRLAWTLAAASAPWPWTTEPAIRGVDDGVPARLDRPRLQALGNAVVPQIPEMIGRAIMAAEEAA